jgi:hypothetical protein
MRAQSVTPDVPRRRVVVLRGSALGSALCSGLVLVVGTVLINRQDARPAVDDPG